MAESIWALCRDSFDAASQEPKHDSRDELLDRLRPQEVATTPAATNVVATEWKHGARDLEERRGKLLMRKSMNQAVLEVLDRNSNVRSIVVALYQSTTSMVVNVCVRCFP